MSLDSQVTPGFSKGAAYDEHRATYAADAVELLLENLQVSGRKNAKILDLAAGTGKFTEALSARNEKYDIVAVEPVGSMRDVLQQKKLPRVNVQDGQADSLPAGDAEFDAVVVAQAFHWFSNLPSLRSIHRVLRRHGTLGLIWNIEHWNAPFSHAAATPWEQKVHSLLWSLKSPDDSPRYRDEQWRRVFDEQVKKTPLSLLAADQDQLFALPVGERMVEWEVRLSREGAWERFATLSQVAVLEGSERRRVRQSFMDAANEAQTDENGDVTVHGFTHLVWMSKIPVEGRSDLTDVETK